MVTIREHDLFAWSVEALAAAGARADDAATIARCLVDVDLRGVRSHGTRQLQRYVGEFRDGAINPAPQICVLRETPVHMRLDGDGGAGYPVALQAVDATCDKAAAQGLALATTRNHGHVGSAGIYARRAADRGLLSWGVAGGTNWSLTDEQGATVWDAMKAPPLCFGVPAAGDGPPLVVDMNANQFGSAERAQQALAAGFGKSVFGSLGMRFVATLLGGQLAGATGTDEPPQTWSAATRGFFFVAIDPALVGDADAFRDSVRRTIDESLTLQPMSGTDETSLPGTPEWRREERYRRDGIPVAEDHQELLENIAMELGLDLPAWQR